MPSLFPCSPAIRECSRKKTHIEKNKKIKKMAVLISINFTELKTRFLLFTATILVEFFIT